MRRVIAALVVVGLAIAVVVLWPRSDDGNTAGEATTTSSTSTTVVASTTTSTTVVTTSTTSVLEDNVVETVEEAEAILRELWFGWFEGIYSEDEDRIREVVASDHQLELALDQFGSMEFNQAPEPSDISYSDTEILRASDTCTVVWATAMFSGFTEGSSSDVHVLRWKQGWRFFSLWAFPDDLWEADCDAELD